MNTVNTQAPVIARGLVQHYATNYRCYGEMHTYREYPEQYFYNRVNRLMKMQAPAIIIAAHSRRAFNYQYIDPRFIMSFLRIRYANRNCVVTIDSLEYGENISTDVGLLTDLVSGIRIRTINASYDLDNDTLRNVLFWWDEERETLVFPCSGNMICFKPEIVNAQTQYDLFHKSNMSYSANLFDHYINNKIQLTLDDGNNIYKGTLEDIRSHQGITNRALYQFNATDGTSIDILRLVDAHYSHNNLIMNANSTMVIVDKETNYHCVMQPL